MPPGGEFVYDFSLPLSKYNTLRYEDKTRQRWQNEGIGEFVRNDRFYCKKKPKTVKVTIRKTYEIPDFLCIFHKDIFTKNQMRFLYKLPIDNRTEMWYNGGPVAGDSARVLPIGSICKIFVQSSRLSYGFLFSRKLTF